MAHRSRLTPATPENAWWRPLLVAIATVPTFVLGFETYAIGAFVLFGLLALLHTPQWIQPRSPALWACTALAVASGAVFALTGAGVIEANLATVLYGLMVAGWCMAVAGVLGGASLAACLGLGAAVWVATTLSSGAWITAGAPAVFLPWLGQHLARRGRSIWRAPNSAARHAFLVAFGVFLAAFAGVYTTVALTGAQGAQDAFGQAQVVCGALVEDCAGFTAVASRSTLVDAVLAALPRNQAGSASVAGLFMILMASWVSARHRAAGRAGPQA